MPKRAHVVLPEELIESVDRTAGKRRRSAFIEEAIREKLAREALGAALRATAGSVDRSEYPAWRTPEATSAWVRAGRSEGDDRPAGELATQES